MTILVVEAIVVELLLCGWLEYFLCTRKRWWKLTAALPFSVAIWLWRKTETIWASLNGEERFRFGLTRTVEKWFVTFWVLGLLIGLTVAICRAFKERAKKERK